MGTGNDYFNQALSDFMFEVASGGSIRHLVDLGYSVDRIMSKLAFPTPRDRVEKTVCQYMKETGILLASLPVEAQNMREVLLEADHLDQVSARFLKSLEQNGEERAYLECPFGTLQKNDRKALEERLACLNDREREYLCGIRWERNIMYHRLNSRMREIAGKLVIYGGEEIKCFFLETGEALTVRRSHS
ncbi:MAG: hypothetical protein NC417_12105 [Candidatus Gastranaerophilales bacterium]|nr:hypothetical protein [Candidatus Gastranaerophilales bacterium]